MASSYGSGLNPSIAPFEPNGRDLAYPIPRPLTSSTNDLGQLILHSHSQMTREIVSLERHTEAISEDIKSITETFRSDMQSLQAMVHGLQSQVNTLEYRHAASPRTIDTNEDDHIKALVHAFKANGNIAPSNALKVLAGNKENLAEAYLEQAEDAENFSAKLREHAHALLGDLMKTPNLNPVKSMESLSIKMNAKNDTASCLTDGNTEKHNIKQQNINCDDQNTTWTPRAVRDMPKYLSSIPNTSETFTWEFLVSELGGEKWSPGFYFTSKESIVESRGYWILEADWEPFLPDKPGQHGAKLTVFFNDTLTESGDAPTEENYLNTPVFIRPKDGQQYHYFGQYSQKRFSDKLDYDRVTVTVPEHVRRCQAEQLADPRRPEWVTRALMENFWPKPAYDGPLPKDNDGDDGGKAKHRVSKALWGYAEGLVEWEREARLKAGLLTATALMKAFENADADAEPGLRMHWEYMQCVAWDQGFHEQLVRRKRKKAEGAAGETGAVKNAVGENADRLGLKDGAEKAAPKDIKSATPGTDKETTEKRSGVRGAQDAAAAAIRQYRELATIGKTSGNGKSLRR